MCKLAVISQERLKIEFRLVLSANRKSYIPRRLTTLSDSEWPFHASRAVSVVAQLLVDLTRPWFYKRNITTQLPVLCSSLDLRLYSYEDNL